VFQNIDYPGDKMATLLVSIEGARNFVVVKNTHRGVEMAMVVEGAVEFTPPAISHQRPFLWARLSGFPHSWNTM
jgi:hypothetical protein